VTSPLTFVVVIATSVCAAHGAIMLQLPTLGAPQGTMHSLPPPQGITVPGWTATTLRLVSDAGNITGVNFSGVNAQGIPRGVYGCFAQIWIAPNADGNYTQTTPGFLRENNSFPSEFNLDSHFLGDPANFVIHSPLQEGNVDFPGFNPIPSDGTYGYGNGRAFEIVHQIALTGYMRGAFDVSPSGQHTSLDLAYVALGGGGFMIGEVYTTGGAFEVAIGFSTGIPFPEPTAAFAIAPLGVALGGRRR
jgi:hypothetical protein